jgi:hypothetical protein
VDGGMTKVRSFYVLRRGILFWVLKVNAGVLGICYARRPINAGTDKFQRTMRNPLGNWNLVSLLTSFR